MNGGQSWYSQGNKAEIARKEAWGPVKEIMPFMSD